MSGEAVRFSPDQRRVVDTWGQGMAVLAGAGSGKTTTLVEKCAELLRRNPEARFAAVSFTERSTSDLRSKLSQVLGGADIRAMQGGSGVLSGHWVSTIHGLCANVIREFPREAGYDGEESMLSEGDSRRLWERAIEGLWFDELSPELTGALNLLLQRESRDGLVGLLTRSRELTSFGALGYLEASRDESSRALGLLSQYVQARYDRLKRRRGAMDFDDLEKGARRALLLPAVRETYHRRFELVLVDEFQDTNPLQAGIIRDFCRPDSSNLCVVGDPKQSIYRFRDADVSVFEDFCARLPSRHSLNWNFRSRPAIIDFTNELCAKAFAASSMPYERLEPKREAQSSGEAVVRLDVDSPAGLARWLRAEIARGVKLEEMALLVRRIRGNEKWFKALTAAGIPLALGSGGLFWEDPRVRELTAFLKWWDNPANVYSGLIFLRAPWVGVPDEALDDWLAAEKKLDQEFLASSHPLARVLEPLRLKKLSPAELLLELLIDQKIEDELGSALLGLWHRVEDLSSSGLAFHEVVLELSRAAEEARRERDVPPPRNLGQLPVLTLHSAKGLEFPHVILIDLGKKPRSQPSPLLFWDREEGTHLVARDEDGEKDKKDPVTRRWDAREKQKSLAESNRVFYVALTRARERLILVCPALDEKQTAEAANPELAFALDHWRAWVECSGVKLPGATGTESPIVESQGTGRDCAPGEVTPSEPTRPQGLRKTETGVFRPRHSVTEWSLLARCPRAYEWTHLRPRLPDLSQGTEVEPESNFEETLSQRELGTRVHRALETADHEDLQAIEEEAGSHRFSAKQVIEWSKNSDRPLPDEERWSELGFEVPIDGEILVGAMDRVVCAGSSGFRILDFKITSTRRSAEELIESYSVPMNLYAWALSRLEPGLRAQEIRLDLVAFSPWGVTEARVPNTPLDVAALARLARELVEGRSGEPRPGKVCEYCRFKSRCPEAQLGRMSSG